jgi:hypothetical protein
MQLDITHFPSSGCAAKPRPASARRAVRQFDALLARRQAFVILSEEGFDEDGHEHPQEERKRASLWMKRNKAAIRAYIQGMVLVEPSAAKRLAGKAFAVMFGKFWGYPRTSAPAATTRSTSPSICSRPGCRPTMIRQGSRCLTQPSRAEGRGSREAQPYSSTVSIAGCLYRRAAAWVRWD